MRVPVDFGLITPATRILEEVLCIGPGERLLIVHDEANADIARAFESAADECGAFPVRLDLERDAPRPWLAFPAAALRSLDGASASVLAIRNEDPEYEVRSQFVAAATAARVRHVHMIGVTRRAFVASLSASVSRVVEHMRLLREAIRPGSRIAVRSKAGTQIDIELVPTIRWYSSGGTLRPGQWMAVPFGALSTSPASVTGTYVADASVGGELGLRLGLLGSRPVRLSLEGGRVRAVECRDPMLKSYVERFVADGHGRERVGLITLGANVGMSAPIGEFVHDENAPGVHLSLGETFPGRTGATWTANGQLGFAMTDADVDLDGEALTRQGRYVRFV